MFQINKDFIEAMEELDQIDGRHDSDKYVSKVKKKDTVWSPTIIHDMPSLVKKDRSFQELSSKHSFVDTNELSLKAYSVKCHNCLHDVVPELFDTVIDKPNDRKIMIKYYCRHCKEFVWIKVIDYKGSILEIVKHVKKMQKELNRKMYKVGNYCSFDNRIV